MNHKKLWNTLKLDSFNAEIPFSTAKPEFDRLLRECSIPIYESSETRTIVKSKLLSLDIDFFIAFQFQNENLTAICMTPDKYLEGSSLHARYKALQKALNAELGRPRNPLRSILNMLDPDSRKTYWQSSDIIIDHSLQNRFGMEETIRIWIVTDKLPPSKGVTS